MNTEPDALTLAYAQILPWLAGGLLLLAAMTVFLGFRNRAKLGRGIGWQFIRFTVLCTALPLIAILALFDKFGAETAAIFGAAIGYLFGKEEKSD